MIDILAKALLGSVVIGFLVYWLLTLWGFPSGLSEGFASFLGTLNFLLYGSIRVKEWINDKR
ncbi:hypothetical protein LCGC14_1666990 [marine sediment metagenome]|uniref:Uncharacterized protein n=1 Tax=marine sediment metagenome TaxID=412755 RepID=A0A0F9KSD4_9ZZZZ